MRTLRRSLGPGDEDDTLALQRCAAFQIRPGLCSPTGWCAAVAQLNQMNKAYLPSELLAVLLQTVKVIYETVAVEHSMRAESPEGAGSSAQLVGAHPRLLILQGNALSSF